MIPQRMPVMALALPGWGSESRRKVEAASALAAAVTSSVVTCALVQVSPASGSRLGSQLRIGRVSPATGTHSGSKLQIVQVSALSGIHWGSNHRTPAWASFVEVVVRAAEGGPYCRWKKTGNWAAPLVAPSPRRARCFRTALPDTRSMTTGHPCFFTRED